MDDVLSDLVDFGNAITECGVADSSAGLHAFLMASIPRNRLPLVFWPIVVGALQAICLSDNGDALIPDKWYATVQNGRLADLKASEVPGDEGHIRLAGSKVPISKWPAVTLPNDFIINKRDPQPLKKKLSDRIHRELNTTNPCGEWMKYSLKPIVVVTRNVGSILRCLQDLLSIDAFGKLDELGSLILNDTVDRGPCDLRNDCFRTPILITTRKIPRFLDISGQSRSCGRQWMEPIRKSEEIRRIRKQSCRGDFVSKGREPCCIDLRPYGL
ncbi:hypothetical protein BRUM_1850 [Bifidobacterium ruminantium]|uniref:Uncharacterized protein n=1 Tax=Bifidobacterium ruminantium TaxID=78346 RepID=A0A087CXV9_BIFRU|nr:hypothetical protein [Bifidobacterium ruminantium]KFI88109.1 hypothetical protein BRUM_1850 [Bifidobacterium ruminantium]